MYDAENNEAQIYIQLTLLLVIITYPSALKSAKKKCTFWGEFEPVKSVHNCGYRATTRVLYTHICYSTIFFIFRAFYDTTRSLVDSLYYDVR